MEAAATTWRARISQLTTPCMLGWVPRAVSDKNASFADREFNGSFRKNVTFVQCGIARGSNAPNLGVSTQLSSVPIAVVWITARLGTGKLQTPSRVDALYD